MPSRDATIQISEVNLKVEEIKPADFPVIVFDVEQKAMLNVVIY